MRPGGPAEKSTVIRPLVYLWVGQNVMLVVSSILRLDLYVEIYMLTGWRIAAFVWMLLVALGLVLIVARIVLDSPTAGWSGMNLIALTIDALYMRADQLSPRSSPTIMSRHSKEACGKGVNLDIKYLVRTRTAGAAGDGPGAPASHGHDLADCRPQSAIGHARPPTWLMAELGFSKLAAAALAGYQARRTSLQPQVEPERTLTHRILTVDDELHIREVIRVALQKAGMAVIEARDGKEALARFAADRPDLIVLDIGMPELDGLEVCRQVRKILRRADPVPDRARRGDRSRAGARDRRRRLRHKTIQPARAGRAGQRDPAPRRRARR